MKKRTRSARQAKGNAAAAAVVLLTNPTKQMVRINQAQSVNIVQTTVSAALSTILWINDLFPDNYFETRSYSLDDPDFSYEIKPVPQTAWEKRTEKRRPADGKANVSWDFLLKGKSEKADKIWSWLVRIHSPFPSSTLLTRYRKESVTPSSVDIWRFFKSAFTTAMYPARL